MRIGSSVLVSVLLFLGGLALLLVGGRLLVSASVDTASRLGVSPLVVGLTLVAWGTSAPELALNLTSALDGRGELALGNVVGANICNLALVLGLCALIRPLVVQQRLVRVEIGLCAGVLAAFAALGLIGGLQRFEAAIMLGLFMVYSVWAVLAALHAARTGGGGRHRSAGHGAEDDPTRSGTPMSWVMIASCFVGGLALLSSGGSLASDGAMRIALGLGVPAAVVGVTIVSIGTTMPEVITGVLAVRRGQTDLAVGNAIGSCLFNACAIFGIAGLIAPPTPGNDMILPLTFMGLLGLAMVPISRTSAHTISRLEGATLLAAYAVFLVVSALSVVGAASGGTQPSAAHGSVRPQPQHNGALESPSVPILHSSPIALGSRDSRSASASSSTGNWNSKPSFSSRLGTT